MNTGKIQVNIPFLGTVLFLLFTMYACAPEELGEHMARVKNGYESGRLQMLEDHLRGNMP